MLPPFAALILLSPLGSPALAGGAAAPRPVHPGWSAAVPELLAFMQSRPDLGASLAPVPGLPPEAFERLEDALGSRALELSAARPARRAAVLDGAGFLRRLPEELRADPEAFRRLPEGEQLSRLVLSQLAAEAEDAARPAAVPSKVGAALARVRALLRPAPSGPRLLEAELDLLFSGAEAVARRDAAPVAVSPEEADRIASEQLAHALGTPLRLEEAKNIAEWVLIPRAKRELELATAAGDAEGARRAADALGRAHAVSAQARRPAPRRLDEVLPSADLGLRAALEAYLGRALSGAARRLARAGAEPALFLRRVLEDGGLIERKSPPGLRTALTMRNEWTNFAALTALQAAQALEKAAGLEAARAVLAPLGEGREHLIRIPDGHPLAEAYFRVADYFASFELRQALDSGARSVLVTLRRHTLTLRSMDFSMTGLPGASLTLTSTEERGTRDTALEPELLPILEAVARERGYRVFQVEGVDDPRDWRLLESQGYRTTPRSDARLRDYYKDLRTPSSGL